MQSDQNKEFSTTAEELENLRSMTISFKNYLL